MIFLPDNQSVPQNTTTQIPPEIKTFLEGLLQDAGMLNLDESMHQEMINELYARLDNFIASTIIDNLPAESVEEFIQMNEQKKPQAEIEQYLRDKMPNSEDTMSKAFMDFRDLYLGNVAVSRNAPASSDSSPDSASQPLETNQSN